MTHSFPPRRSSVLGAWAKAKFAELGFDRVWIEPVTFPRWLRGVEPAAVLTPYPQPLHIPALGLSVGSNGPIEADVVAFTDLAALSAAKAGSLNGKIAYIANRMTRARDGKGYGPAVAARVKGASEAVSKGALALLIRSIGTDHDRMPHTGMLQYAAGENAPIGREHG